jgi:hypothetical protein
MDRAGRPKIGGSVDVIEGPPSRIDPNQFIRRHEAHAKRWMIGQLLYFQFVRLKETFHDGQTVSMTEGVHRMQTIWKLGHHQIGFTLYREEVPDGDRIEKRHVTGYGKHRCRHRLLQSGIETAQASTARDEIPPDRHISVERRTVLGNDDNDRLKDRPQNRETVLIERFLSDGQEALILSHSATFSPRQEHACHIGNHWDPPYSFTKKQEGVGFPTPSVVLSHRDPDAN